MRYQAALLAALSFVACTPQSTNNTTATLRNDPPAACTTAQLNACPVAMIQACPDGSQPVIDYSSDCCAHFSCQPTCQAAKPCARTPAPACPYGTKLWIGTALEDCCPAYRCEPDTACDPATPVACTLAMPYCGDGLMPIVVGQTSDCCPVFQCPCEDTATSTSGSDPKPDSGAAPRPDDPNMKLCGCTFPNCAPGEEVQCAGMDPCGGPCTCVPGQGTCQYDSECPMDSRCELTTCMAGPGTDAAPPMCDPASCGPAPKMANYLCPDGKTMAGPSQRCVPNAAGTCAWEIVQCPAEPIVCDASKCGPALGMPNRLCPDGKTVAGPGRCLDMGGRCGWEIVECPPVPCDPTTCGPAPLMANYLCPDQTTLAGPTGRCMPSNDGKCEWEFVQCQATPPDPKCFGVCVPNIQAGCRADAECPSGQRCDVVCSGWGCSPAGAAPCTCSSTDPTCECPSEPPTCTCPAGDPTCKCDPTTGECGGQSCQGQCVPVGPVCDPSKPVACPAMFPACANNVKPVLVGNDPATCCPVYKCPSCDTAGDPSACPMPGCMCAKVTGTDPLNCCPTYECGAVGADGKCQ